jgi:hypothetical protein
VKLLKKSSPFWESVYRVEARSEEKRIINMAWEITSEKFVSVVRCSASAINRSIILYLVTRHCNVEKRCSGESLAMSFFRRPTSDAPQRYCCIVLHPFSARSVPFRDTHTIFVENIITYTNVCQTKLYTCLQESYIA